jgi:hypothetical protein
VWQLPGKGAAGGNIENITIKSAFTSDLTDPNAASYRLDAGDGANGTSGGNGGSIINVSEISSNGSAFFAAAMAAPEPREPAAQVAVFAALICRATAPATR